MSEPRGESNGNDGEKLRIRAVFVPSGERAPSDMLYGMGDTIRIPARVIGGSATEGGNEPGPEGDSRGPDGPRT